MRGSVKLLALSLLVTSGCFIDDCGCEGGGDSDCSALNNNRPTNVPTAPPPPPPLTLRCEVRNTRPESELEWGLVIGGGRGPYAYTVNFGDQTPDATGNWGGTGSQPRGFHDYERPGDFQVSAQVRDAAAQTQTCTIVYSAPTPDLGFSCTATPQHGTAPMTVAFDTSNRRGCIGPCSVTWYFGDGESVQAGRATHEYAFPGPSAQQTYAAFAELRDGLDRTVQCRKPIQVLPGPIDPQRPANHPPSVTSLAGNPATINAGQSTTISGTTSDPDPGDTVVWELTLDASGAGTISPSSGTGAILATYTSSTTTSGDKGIRATVVDNHGLIGPYGTTVVHVNQLANHPPSILSLAANPPTILAGGPPAQITATFSDPDGDPLTWTLALDSSTTATGTFSATTGNGNLSATFSATATPGNQGPAVLRITVSDPAGLSDTGTLTVNVALGKQ